MNVFFLYFEEMHNFSGTGIATQVLTILKKSRIDIGNMVEKGYDYATAVFGIRNEVQKDLRDECPAAVYTTVQIIRSIYVY